MSLIMARVPQVDLSKGFERHWHRGGPAVTHAFNALSLLFPQAEKLFIDVAGEAARSMDMAMNPKLKEDVQGFIAQESVHSRQHAEYNQALKNQGFENVAHYFVLRLQEQSSRRFSLLTRLAIVAAYEHYTAILGNYILNNPDVLKLADPDMALVWGWHSAEETEHKAVCFDLYHAAGGGWLRRVAIFFPVTINFSLMFNRNYLSMLWRDGCFKPMHILKTINQASRFFFGRSGIGWYFIRDGLRYLSSTFDPWNQDNRLKMQAWFVANQSRLSDIGGADERSRKTG